MTTSNNRTELTNDEIVQWNRASDLLDDGIYSDAQLILDDLLRQPRTVAKLYAHRGFARYNQGQLRGAIEDFSEALMLSPGGRHTLFLRGRCLEELEDFDLAVRDYDAVIAIAPNTADAHAQRGYCFEQLGRHDEARSAYYAALALDSEETLALAGLKSLGGSAR